MVRTGQAAVDYANASIGANVMPPGYCLVFTRNCFDIGAYYGSAIDAWNGAQWRHEGDRNPPPGVPLFFRTPSVYDHVCISTEVPTDVSTYDDDVRKFHDGIAQIEQQFGSASYGPAQYLGWTEDLNGVRVYEGEDDMPSAEEVAQAVWNHSLTYQGAGPAPAYVFLADARGFGIAANDALGRMPATVWDHERTLNGAGPAGMAVFVGDARAYSIAAKDAAQEAAANTADPATRAVAWQTVLALILAVAIVVGLVFAVLFSTREGIVSGAAVLLGGIIGWVATTLRIGSRGARHV